MLYAGGGKGWLLVMTKGHVFYQEPVRVASQLFYSPDLKVSRLLDREGRERGGARGDKGEGLGWGALNLGSRDIYFLHVSSNDAGQG